MSARRTAGMGRTASALAALLGTLAVAACATAGPRGVAPAAEAPLELAWSDEFETVEAAHWTFETGGHGWGNRELQYYSDGGNAFIQYDPLAGSRVLVIEARRGAPAGAGCW